MATEESDSRIDTVNILIGELAVKEKLVTLDQLRRALDEQARELDVQGCPKRSLGQILVSLGFLSNERLAPLLHRLHERTRNPATAFRERSLLGQLLIRGGAVGVAQVADCLRIQRELQDDARAAVPRLGELLVREGHTTPARIQEALAAQEKARTPA